MSYILDALNKSEQDRKRRQSPGLEALQRPRAPARRSVTPWLMAIALLLALNAGGFAWWLLHDESPVPGPAIAVTPTPIEAQRAPESVVSPAPVNKNLETAPVTRSREQLITPTDYESEYGAINRPASGEPPVADTVRISSLPAAIQQRIPDLRFSSHIFADDRSFRMVSINGESLREGDSINGEVRLEEITEEGVILALEGYRFEVSVLRDWTYN